MHSTYWLEKKKCSQQDKTRHVTNYKELLWIKSDLDFLVHLEGPKAHKRNVLLDVGLLFYLPFPLPPPFLHLHFCHFSLAQINCSKASNVTSCLS